MTLEQLKTEFRLAYEGRDRERLERALRWIGSVTDAGGELEFPLVKNPQAEWPFKERSK